MWCTGGYTQHFRDKSPGDWYQESYAMGLDKCCSFARRHSARGPMASGSRYEPLLGIKVKQYDDKRVPNKCKRMDNSWLGYGSLFLVVFCITEGTVVGDVSKQDFLQTLLETDYDGRVPPNFNTEEPTVVECQLFIYSFDSFSESTMDFSVNMFLRQQWTDYRLHFHDLIPTSIIQLDSRFLSNIWVPDLYFVNGKNGKLHDVTMPNRLIHVYRNATVLYNIRVSVTFSCPMDLTYYPLDLQICYIEMASFAFTTDKLIFKWREFEPIKSNPNVKLPQFKLVKIENTTCDDPLDVGSFTCIRAELHLSRQFGYFGAQVYLPSGSVVLISWISFWLNVDSVPARISLGLLTVLTMTTQFSSVRDKLPSVSYVTALDVWMSACLLFVIISLLEFALVNVLVRRDYTAIGQFRVSDNYGAKEGYSRSRDVYSRSSRDEWERKPKKISYSCIPSNKFLDRARFVDKAARVVFPVTFLIFNVAYWIMYVEMWNK